MADSAIVGKRLSVDLVERGTKISKVNKAFAEKNRYKTVIGGSAMRKGANRAQPG